MPVNSTKVGVCHSSLVAIQRRITPLRIPSPRTLLIAANDGACHFREFANARVMAARSRAQSGSIRSECVMLRCQVMIRSRSLEKISRKTSESGKTAPSISDHVRMRPRFIGCDANMSSPRKIAFPISAPAMPWVMVSILEVYRMLAIMILMNKEKRVFLHDDFSDAAGGDAVMLQGGESRFSGFGRDGDEQTSGGLRIEKQILILGRDAGVKSDAIANESAVILEAAGEMAFAGSFHGAGKIGEGFVVDFERNGFNAVRWIAEGHFSRVPKKAEARNVSNSVDAFRAGGIFVKLLQRECGIAIQGRHRGDDGGERFRRGSILLQRGGDDSGAQGFGEKQNVSRVRADISPNPMRVDDAGDRVAEEHVLVTNRVAADDAALRFVHFRKAAANDLFEDGGIALFRKSKNRQRGNRAAAH